MPYQLTQDDRDRMTMYHQHRNYFFDKHGVKKNRKLTVANLGSPIPTKKQYIAQRLANTAHPGQIVLRAHLARQYNKNQKIQAQLAFNEYLGHLYNEEMKRRAVFKRSTAMPRTRSRHHG